MTETATIRADLERLKASRPEAVMEDTGAIFGPGVVFFFDGKFHTIGRDISAAWEFLSPFIQALFEFAPAKHSLEAWRARFESGASLMVAYVDSAKMEFIGAGFISCESDDEGKSFTLAAVGTIEPLDYSELMAMCETIACVVGTDYAALATTREPPLFPGYHEIPLGLCYAQAIPVCPIQ